MMKLMIVALVSIVAGFIAGTWWVASDLDEAQAISAAAKLMREDKVLAYLEAKDYEAAMRVQTEFLRLSITEVSEKKRAWPPEVQSILKRRSSLQSAVDR